MSIAISNIDLYNILRTKIGEKEAQSLTTFIENEVKDKFDSQKQHLATKEDTAIIRKEIAENKSDLLKWLVALFLPF